MEGTFRDFLKQPTSKGLSIYIHTSDFRGHSISQGPCISLCTMGVSFYRDPFLGKPPRKKQRWATRKWTAPDPSKPNRAGRITGLRSPAPSRWTPTASWTPRRPLGGGDAGGRPLQPRAPLERSGGEKRKWKKAQRVGRYRVFVPF